LVVKAGSTRRRPVRNHENEWRFQSLPASPYAFAFDDWRLDENGFPHAASPP
jgi:hypothetical protein